MVTVLLLPPDDKEVICPDWAAYLAQDRDGEWHVFRSWPHLICGSWLCFSGSEFIYKGTPPDDPGLELYILEEVDEAA